MKTAYDHAGGYAAGVTDAWEGMLELVGGDSAHEFQHREGGELRWRPLPPTNRRFIPWWTRALTAAKAQEHLWVWTGKLGKTDGTLYVMWSGGETIHSKQAVLYDVALLWAPEEIEAINPNAPPWALL